MATTHYLLPDYVLNFKCQMCTECCKRWRISLDKDTMEKYEKLASTDQEFSDLLAVAVKKSKKGSAFVQLRDRQKNEMTEVDGEQQLKITIEQAVCPFLGSDNLCVIQKKFGIEALSDTCKIFPRNITHTERGFEMSLTYSCAATAETLKSKKKIEFYQDPEDFEYPELNGQYAKIGTVLERNKAGKTNYFKAEELFIDIMQIRKLDIDTRLVLTGIVIDKLKDGDIDGIRKYLENLNESLIQELKSIPSKPTFMMKLVKEVVDKRLLQGGISEQDMNKLLGLAYGPLMILDEVMVSEEKVQKILEGYNQYYKPYLNDISHIYENYFVNFLFSKKFYTHKYMDAFFLMIFFYTIIRFFTLCTCLAEQRNVDEDMVVSVIQAIERSIGHNSAYYEDVLRQIKHGGYHNLPYVISLINL